MIHAVVLIERGLILMLTPQASLGSDVILNALVLNAGVLGSKSLGTNHVSSQMLGPSLNGILMLNAHSGIVLNHSVGMGNPILNSKTSRMTHHRLAVTGTASKMTTLIGNSTSNMSAAETTDVASVKPSAAETADMTSVEPTHVAATESASAHVSATESATAHVATAEPATTHVAAATHVATTSTVTSAAVTVCVNNRLADKRDSEKENNAETDVATHGQPPLEAKAKNTKLTAVNVILRIVEVPRKRLSDF